MLQKDYIKEPEGKGTKTKRVFMLTYESLIDRVDAYAAKRGVSRTVVIETAVEAFMDAVEEKTNKRT